MKLMRMQLVLRVMLMMMKVVKFLLFMLMLVPMKVLLMLTWGHTLCSGRVVQSNPVHRRTLRSGNFRVSHS